MKRSEEHYYSFSIRPTGRYVNIDGSRLWLWDGELRFKRGLVGAINGALNPQNCFEDLQEMMFDRIKHGTDLPRKKEDVQCPVA